jgi:AsmA family protein
MPTTRRSAFRRGALGLALGVAGFAVLVLVAGIGGFIWLRTADFKSLVEREASEALGRSVTASRLEVRWGNPLKVELADLRIANAPWGSQPDMVRIARLSALIDPWALWHGVVRYERLRIDDAKVVLERDPDGRGNWKFEGGESGLVLVPKDRTRFPTLIDFAGERGLITYRTRSGQVLRIALDSVAITSPDDITPARVVATGAYNDVPVELDATTDGYAALRDPTLPFVMRFTLTGQDSQIAFDGTAMGPLDFEGVRGAFTLDAQRLDDILRVMGEDRAIDLPLSIAGVLARTEDLWSLSAAKGGLAEAPFSGALALLEGGPGEPDDITLDLDFSSLDADAIAAAFGNGRGTSLAALSLRPGGLARLNLTADLHASELALGGRRFREVSVEGRMAGGTLTAEEVSFAFGGGTLITSGVLEDGHLSLDARLVRARIAEIASTLGIADGEIRGRLDGAARLRMHGDTVGAALKSSVGALVLAVRAGTVERALVEELSADLRQLFREQDGRVPVSCLLGVMVVRDGVGVLGPLRLESREAVVLGGGKVDLNKRTLDLTLKTLRGSTSFFALDIPVRVSGPFAKVNAEPAPDTDTEWLDDAGSATVGTLPAGLARLAKANSCVR